MVKEVEKVYIWLSLFNLSYKKYTQLFQLYDNPLTLWEKFSSSNVHIRQILSDSEISQMEFSKDDNFIKTYVDNCKSQNIEIVTIASSNYPKLLLEIDGPPLVLYCRGNLKLLNSKCFAVVGSRTPTRYGKEVTKQFAGALARAGITIVSGLSYGIDTQAHLSALENNGNTIAVLGGGLNEIYPASNIGLAREIAKKGLIISEYKPNEKPKKYYFPLRNRIIAGLSDSVFIPEASEKSGSMQTKNYALDYNRHVFVVPGRITDQMSVGCNKIIKNLQASMVLDPQEILTFYGVDEKSKNKTLIQLDFNDEIVLSSIPNGEIIHYEELLVKTKLEPKILNTTLTRLEIKGLVKKDNGNFYYK